jgi:type IX secretion system PorP/SprF family membrane protein
MHLNRFLLSAASIILLLSYRANAQYLHFTQNSFVPITVNPAQAGLFEGTYRVGGLLRSQYQTGGFKGYQTPVIYVDVPIKGLRKQDWIGVGLNLHRDAAGSAVLTNTLVAGNVSYHVGLNKRQTSVFSVGVQVGYNQRNIDRGKLVFGDAILKGGSSADQPLIDAQNKTFTPINVGFNLKGLANKTTSYNFGLSLDNILRAKYNLLTSTPSSLTSQLNMYGTIDMVVRKKYVVSPAGFIRYNSGGLNIMGQTTVGMVVDSKKNIVPRAGLGYRLGDAAQILVGMDYGDFRFGGAFDYTLNKLAQTSTNNGFELAVGYIGKIFKSNKPPKVILCPQY